MKSTLQAIFLCISVACALSFLSEGFRRAAPQQLRTLTVSATAAELDGPDTEMFRRFGHLKGKEVKTVSESLKEFYSSYRKPVLPQYRNVVNDLIQSTHLSVVNGCFIYDAIFAYGLYGIFFRLMRSYPGANEPDAIFNALISCLGMNPEKVREDAVAVAALTKEMSASEFESALSGEGSSIIADISKSVKADNFYLYTKPWGIGLIQLMEAFSYPLTEEMVESLISKAGFSPTKAKQDLLQYRDVIEKADQAEQLFKEIEIREKKRMAERLEEKARRALEKANQVSEED